MDKAKIKADLKNEIQKVDLTFDASWDGQPSAAFLGIRNTEFVLSKSAEIPVLKPVCIIIKKLLNTYGLNKPFSGGMSSFTVFLMASAFIQMNPVFIRPSHCLLHFLDYYGNIFDYTKMAIMGGYIALLQTNNRNLVNVGIAISSPLQPEVNVAYNVTRYEEIRECFRKAHKKLIDLKSKIENGKTDSIKILPAVLEAEVNENVQN